MRLPPGQFFGSFDREIEYGGLRFTARSYEPGQEQPWHTHQYVTFFAHVCGDQVDEGQVREWTLPPLGLIFHPASTIHRSRLGPTPVRGINLELSSEWFADHEISPSELGAHRVSTSERVQWAIMRMLRTYVPSPLGGQEISNMALELLEAFLPGQDTETLQPRWLAVAEEKIRSEFREPISLAGVAREVGVHPMHLARVYRSRFSRSVTDQIQRLRLRCAIKQVLAGDCIGSAALDAGFSDQFHFSRTLKAHLGYSPKLIRQLRDNRLACCDRS